MGVAGVFGALLGPSPLVLPLAPLTAVAHLPFAAAMASVGLPSGLGELGIAGKRAFVIWWFVLGAVAGRLLGAWRAMRRAQLAATPANAPSKRPLTTNPCVQTISPNGACVNTYRAVPCIWAVAPNATAAAVIADHFVGPMGNWAVGPNVKSEVFPRSEYAKHADPGDFTRMVIDRPVRRRWLEKRLRAQD